MTFLKDPRSSRAYLFVALWLHLFCGMVPAQADTLPEGPSAIPKAYLKLLSTEAPPPTRPSSNKYSAVDVLDQS